jgi:hypothetical protein
MSTAGPGVAAERLGPDDGAVVVDGTTIVVDGTTIVADGVLAKVDSVLAKVDSVLVAVVGAAGGGRLDVDAGGTGGVVPAGTAMPDSARAATTLAG